MVFRAGSKLRSVAAFIVLCASIGCSSLRVPLDSPTFKAEEFFYGERDGLRLEVRPIEGTTDYWEMFDENLPEAGIGVLWARLSSTRSEPVDLKELDWLLKMGMRNFRDLNSQEVLEQFYKGTGKRMRTLAADESSRRNLEGKMFKLGLLPPSQMLEGFVFLRIPTNSATNWYQGGAVIARGIRLDNGRKTQIEVPLANSPPRR
jgi:hypothetical protein